MDLPQSHGDTERRTSTSSLNVHRCRHRGAPRPRAWPPGRNLRNGAVHRTRRTTHHVRAASEIPANYKGRSLGQYEVDLIVEDLVIVEVKSVAHVLPVFEAQLITYLRLTGKRVGLIINFNTQLLKDGVVRRVL